MTIRDWTTSPRIKIARADKHIEDLASRLAEWTDCGGYTIVEEIEANDDAVYRLRIVRPLDESWGAIVGDALNNLRSALDTTVWQFVRARHGIASPECKFAILGDSEKQKAFLKGKKETFGKELHDLINEAEAYHRGGNKSLSLLANIDNESKHRGIFPVVVDVSHAEVSFEKMRFRVAPAHRTDPKPIRGFSIQGDSGAFSPTIRPLPRGPLNDNDILFRVTAAERAAQAGMQLKPIIQVAFGDSEFIQCEPILKTLVDLRDYVASLLDPFFKLTP